MESEAPSTLQSHQHEPSGGRGGKAQQLITPSVQGHTEDWGPLEEK